MNAPTDTSASGVRGHDPDAHPSSGSGHASAKAILFGEHAVVYGHPALAVPLTAVTADASARPIAGPSTIDSELYTGPAGTAPERLLPTATALRAASEAFGVPGVSLRIASAIPAERGLGSSAAVAAAVIAAVAASVDARPTDAELHELIQAAERAAHGSPSGLDARAVRASGPIWFEAGQAAPIEVTAPLHLVVADSGVRGRTREAVGGVRSRRADAPADVDRMLEALGALARHGRARLGTGDVTAVGAAMTEAHALLGALGVGDPALDALVGAALAEGALGAKLTGGGRGGCILAVADDAAHARHLAAHLHDAGAAAVWTSTVEATA